MAELPSIALPAGALVISDLHLDASSVDSARAFLGFLRAARGRKALLILGDLFDAWVGPAHARLAGAEAILAGLRAASETGTAISLVPGNRDFLLDDSFSAATGVRIFPEGVLAALPGGSRVLFLHGDELCTLDLSYQRMKRIVRSPVARWLAPRLPDALALGVARRLRRASKTAVMQKPAEMKRQQALEVRSRAAAARAGTLVCGHAHEFRDEALAGGPRWIVLDAFGGPHDLIEVSAAGALEARSSASLTRS
ncbi:MAG TPA: UDP-2,3-diacylglucosamine diphosphatase [Planctomycetota bacterium]|nr:UDP-2,3-diacylglucosamine diphosphatase [Planctomycetota bacterium]